MKYLLSFLVITPIISFSQITLTDTDFSNSNDTVRISATTDFNVDYSSTGTNWTWDFSTLIAESQSLLHFKSVSDASSLSQLLFGGFAPVNYQASYFVASDDLPLDQLGGFLPVNITDIFQFSRVTSDSISSVGFSITVEGNEIPFRSDTIEKRYQLPLNFQDTYTGRGYTEMDLSPFADIIWRQHRGRESEVDGWGSIVLPMGNFDVLRVRHTITEIDSVYNDFFGTPMWFGIDLPTAYIYEWLAPGEKEPVLRIETSLAGGSENVTNIEFRDNYNPLLADIDELVLTPEIYPNPAKEEIRVEKIPEGTAYMVVDITGVTVLQGFLSSSQSIGINTLSSGNYILVVKSGDTWSKAAFIKE